MKTATLPRALPQDFDDVGERPPYIISLPVIASFVVIFMAISMIAISKKHLHLYVLQKVAVANSTALADTIVHANTVATRQALTMTASEIAASANATVSLYNETLNEAKMIPQFGGAKIDGQSVIVPLQSDAFFGVGGANIKPSAQQELIQIVNGLKQLPPNFQLVVEGYTDGTPVHYHKWKYPTNWELSTFRAAAVVHLFEEQGFSPKRMMVAGYGSQRPRVDEHGLNGAGLLRAKRENRRITLRIVPLTNSSKG